MYKKIIYKKRQNILRCRRNCTNRNSKKNRSDTGIKDLKRNLQKELNCVNRKLNITITRIAKPYRHPNLLAEFITETLSKSNKNAIELAEQTETKGIKIQITGRLGGKDIAHVDWIRECRVPLQTIRAKIHYCTCTIRTIYEILCIKIWIFIDEK
ncbi:hypothetical protein Cgig2_000763 [Carnegiea gigantea]|uniref:Small ribosomal subunit protein uS3c n=1 Tax=Carnegiea gigantea TaxID=171969 RepID=A0A9Q1JQQ7_9CARY|nr:hypothetical protein Cgig2_000763 [Carnegiea gigantea]